MFSARPAALCLVHATGPAMCHHTMQVPSDGPLTRGAKHVNTIASCCRQTVDEHLLNAFIRIRVSGPCRLETDGICKMQRRLIRHLHELTYLWHGFGNIDVCCEWLQHMIDSFHICTNLFVAFLRSRVRVSADFNGWEQFIETGRWSFHNEVEENPQRCSI